MAKPFSILDLVCDEDGNPVKTEMHEYIEKLENQLKEIKRLTDLVWNLPVNEIPIAYVRDIHDIIHDWEEYQLSPTINYTGVRT